MRDLTPEERRERREVRGQKQRENNILRSAKMHKSRLKWEAEGCKTSSGSLNGAAYVSCSGWRYWKWRDSFYQDVPQPEWFNHYAGVNARMLHGLLTGGSDSAAASAGHETVDEQYYDGADHGAH